MFYKYYDLIKFATNAVAEYKDFFSEEIVRKSIFNKYVIAARILGLPIVIHGMWRSFKGQAQNIRK